MLDIRSMINVARSMISCARSSNQVPQQLCKELLVQLNGVFKCKPQCDEVIVTNNIDKPMFGIIVYPESRSSTKTLLKSMVSGLDVDDCNPYSHYIIDIDSKLLVMLNAPELCAMIINDINELFTKSTFNMASNAINAIIAFNGETSISDNELVRLNKLLELSFAITMHNISSCVVIRQEDGVNTENEFSVSLLKEYGLYDHLISGRNALKSFGDYWNALTVHNPAIMLNWYFAHYKDNTYSVISDELQSALKLEASQIIKRKLMVVIRDTTTIPAELDRYYISLTEATTKHKKGLIGQMKRNGLKSLEEDLYEYSMRLRNIDTQDDAILLMRQLNSRISILDDYLTYEEISASERSRWQAVYDEYQKIRGELTKKTVYNRKMYGLFVDYNALADMSKTQQQQILQSYY